MGGQKSPGIGNLHFGKTEEQVVKSPANSPYETELELNTGDKKAGILRLIEELKSQIESSYAIRETLQSDLNNAKKALSDKEKEVEELYSPLISIKSNLPTVKGLEDEIKFLNQELGNTHERVETLERELQDREKTIKDLQSMLISAEREKSKVIQEKMSEVEKSRDLQRELANVARERDNAFMKTKHLELEIMKLRESRNALEEIHKALADTKRTAKR